MTEETFDHQFWMEVNRAAYELGMAHGWSAASYAAKKERALAEDKLEEHRFWTAVAAANTPR